MDNRAEVREFLMSRRARLTPHEVGIPAHQNRRVPGLRRGEVAAMAGVSEEYYAKLERGAIASASVPVLDAVCKALQLDEIETAHLYDLARTAGSRPAAHRSNPEATRDAPRASLLKALGSVVEGIAFVRDPRQNLVAVNDLGRLFYAPLIGDQATAPNFARFQFLNPASRDFYPDWDLYASMCVGIMRAEAGRHPLDKTLHSLIGELSTRSKVFRTLWARHDVRTHVPGIKRFHHPVVGALEFSFEEFSISAEPGNIMMIYTADKGSPSAERLQLLASWGADHALPPGTAPTPSSSPASGR
ncbi:helix-turn-helix domain-containing protein [Microbacterium sp. ISL-103]|uniref:helix-turn-helix transcriptional regulator n=1 Tax=Microbacterium sp. ISL-103 TaxID=2819156 RepID=UPI001BEC0F6A|nr:helix-turn-helix transcriptional regulator [Microbacterium sp. ISL-103]MBT2475660.1 helix-turn-helix domain-containing protein [Microbacterium sp. ISL-103]